MAESGRAMSTLFVFSSPMLLIFVILLGDYLYIEGGKVSNYINGVNKAKGKDPWDFTSQNVTLSIPLHSSWKNSTVTIKTIDKPNDVPPPISRFSLWSNEASKKMYRWAGENPIGYADDDYKPLYEFSSDGEGGGQWAASSPSNPGTFDYLKRSLEGAGASCDGMGYHTGGWSNNETDPSETGATRLGGLYTYNMETREWSNFSTDGISSSGYIQGANAVCVKGFGENPLLMFFGGEVAIITKPGENIGTATAISFRDIAFWDTVTHIWYKQATTPTNEQEIPTPRYGSCTIGVQGPNGTYEIYIYGGYSELNDEVMDDIWVLTLPGFHWLKLSAKGTTSRWYHSCTLVGKRQMLVMGGTERRHQGFRLDDPWPRGLGIFDLTKAEWSDQYNAEADDYKSPNAVQTWYDNGGLAKVNWGNESIKTIFMRASNNSSSNSATTESPVAKESSKTQVGAIASGVIGAVAGLVLIGAGLFFYRRRRHQHQPQKSPVDSPQSSPDYQQLKPTELDPHVVLRPPPWELESRQSPVELDGSPENRR